MQERVCKYNNQKGKRRNLERHCTILISMDGDGENKTSQELLFHSEKSLSFPPPTGIGFFVCNYWRRRRVGIGIMLAGVGW
mmetsp:Transcript_10205/g.16814  ORF Transcript_10205/g.16814 Transcript_10205/m.16814 type:complete len:81 (+) Transcript_10205:1167-1409(+)